MRTGKVDDVLILQNMMLVYLGQLHIQWDWSRCPSPWHALHLPCWVFNVWSRQVWDNQCLTAVLWKIPCVFHFFSFFSISGYMMIHACNKNKITTFYRWQWKYLTVLLSKFALYHTAITISKTNVGSSLKKQNQWTLWDHVIPSAFYSFHLISFTRISRGPSRHKSGSLNIKYSTKITCQCMYEPLPSPRRSHSQNDPKTLPGPRPSLRAASTVAPAEISCSTTAAWSLSAA